MLMTQHPASEETNSQTPSDPLSARQQLSFYDTKTKFMFDQRLNFNHQAWQQEPLPAELSPQQFHLQVYHNKVNHTWCQMWRHTPTILGFGRLGPSQST